MSVKSAPTPVPSVSKCIYIYEKPSRPPVPVSARSWRSNKKMGDSKQSCWQKMLRCQKLQLKLMLMLMFAVLIKEHKTKLQCFCKAGTRTEFCVRGAFTTTCLKPKANRKCNWFTSKIPTLQDVINRVWQERIGDFQNGVILLLRLETLIFLL